MSNRCVICSMLIQKADAPGRPEYIPQSVWNTIAPWLRKPIVITTRRSYDRTKLPALLNFLYSCRKDDEMLNNLMLEANVNADIVHRFTDCYCTKDRSLAQYIIKALKIAFQKPTNVKRRNYDKIHNIYLLGIVKDTNDLTPLATFQSYVSGKA